MAYSYSWPATLPQTVLRDGYSEAPGLLVETFPMDAGVSRTQFAGISPDLMPISMQFTTEQLGYLRTFVYDDVRGTSRFGFPHPRTREMVEVRFVPNGDKKIYSVSPIGYRLWQVTFTLWVLP
jgi:hypothetical protein